MPEIAEVARVVHYLRKRLVGKTLKVVNAPDDTVVFGKAGTSGPEFQKALTGKKVIEAGQQGKYFWLIMSSPPHPVFHLGMKGWFHIRDEPGLPYKPKDPKVEETWPPKFWKFTLETDDNPKVEAAFTDMRRFARIRLVNCPGTEIRNVTPLKENGPDPVIDREVITLEWLTALMKKKHVPVKALLLDQANISGIGNWVGDEIMYHAKLHPEQYSNTFTDAQLKQLRTSIFYVCETAVGVLADSNKFPEDWLFNYRWSKGKKDAATKLPTGAQITFITVGGRTSCVIPSVQKKTGPVAGDVKENGKDDDTSVKKKGGASGKAAKSVKASKEEQAVDVDASVEKKNGVARKATRKRKAAAEEEDVAPAEKSNAGVRGKRTKKSAAEVKGELTESEEESKVENPKAKTGKRSAPSKGSVKPSNKVKQEVADPAGPGRRRSTRASNGRG